jgi:hypothetical protein
VRAVSTGGRGRFCCRRGVEIRQRQLRIAKFSARPCAPRSL